MDYKVCGVFGAEKNKEENKEEKYYFKLNDFEQSVLLEVVNQSGESIANILIIGKKTGKVTRTECVSDKIGFDLDSCGRVKVE